MLSSDPHHREAAAAQAAIAEFYGTVWKPQRGDAVRCPRAFGDGYQDGTVYGTADGGYLVDTPEGRLFLYLEELKRL